MPRQSERIRSQKDLTGTTCRWCAPNLAPRDLSKIFIDDVDPLKTKLRKVHLIQLNHGDGLPEPVCDVGYIEKQKFVNYDLLQDILTQGIEISRMVKAEPDFELKNPVKEEPLEIDDCDDMDSKASSSHLLDPLLLPLKEETPNLQAWFQLEESPIMQTWIQPEENLILQKLVQPEEPPNLQAWFQPEENPILQKMVHPEEPPNLQAWFQPEENPILQKMVHPEEPPNLQAWFQPEEKPILQKMVHPEEKPNLQAWFPPKEKPSKKQPACRTSPSVAKKLSPPCMLRSKVFLTQEQLTIHSQQRIGARSRFNCNTCNKTYIIKSRFFKHKRQHTRERKHTVTKETYVCNVCKKNLCSQWSLSLHIGTHSGKRPYSCKDCKKTFTIKQKLTVHACVARDTGPSYKCTVCKKNLSSQWSLKCHMRVHTGERPYSCKVCSKTFINKQKFSMHAQKHTGSNER